MTIEARDMLIAIDNLCNHDFNQCLDKIQHEKYTPTDEQISQAYMAIPPGFYAITMLDEDYPELLKKSFKPPFVLYAKGIVNTNKKYIFVVGNNTIGIAEDRLSYYNSNTNSIVFGKDFEIMCGSSVFDKIRVGMCLSDKVFVNNFDKYNSYSEKNALNAALAFGKDIFVKPTYKQSYNNTLIKQGAYLADSIEDLS